MEIKNKTTRVRLAVEQVIGKKYSKLHNDLRSNNIRRLKFSNVRVTKDQLDLLNNNLKVLNAKVRKHVTNTVFCPLESIVVTFETENDQYSM
jgi:hypothetical protein